MVTGGPTGDCPLIETVSRDYSGTTAPGRLAPTNSGGEIVLSTHYGRWW
jgi:hypothetical protein